MNPFAKSKLGRTVALIAQLPQRPSDIVRFEGSPLERILFDMEVLSKAEPFGEVSHLPKLPGTKGIPRYKGKGSVRSKILARRRRLGMYT